MTLCGSHLNPARWKRVEAGRSYQSPALPGYMVTGYSDRRIVYCGDCGRFIGYELVTKPQAQKSN
jgi:hypothetical protein